MSEGFRCHIAVQRAAVSLSRGQGERYGDHGAAVVTNPVGEDAMLCAGGRDIIAD